MSPFSTPFSQYHPASFKRFQLLQSVQYLSHEGKDEDHSFNHQDHEVDSEVDYQVDNEVEFHETSEVMRTCKGMRRRLVRFSCSYSKVT